MKNKSLFPCLFVLFYLSLSSCQSPNKNVVQSSTTGTITFSRTYPFTSLEAKDVFKVELTGDKPENMVLNFNISNASGQSIYSVQIKGTDLLGSTDPNVDLRLEADQISFIQNIAESFLSDEQFLEPAVMPDQVADSWAPDPNFYNNLKKSGLNGFTYRLGKEDNYYIAYDSQSNTAKVYYNCC